jgi:ribosomal-protein-alanine N-acetyltransferase
MKSMISEASYDDIDSLAQLELQLEASHSPFSLSQLQLEMRTPRTVILIARNEEELTGYLIQVYQALSSHIKRLVVARAHRRMGIASQLILEAILKASARKISEVTLLVAEDNLAAIALYQKHRFAEDGGSIEDYYGEGRRALRLRLCIEESGC